jgi:hypothetical protein
VPNPLKRSGRPPGPIQRFALLARGFLPHLDRSFPLVFFGGLSVGLALWLVGLRAPVSLGHLALWPVLVTVGGIALVGGMTSAHYEWEVSDLPNVATEVRMQRDQVAVPRGEWEEWQRYKQSMSQAASRALPMTPGGTTPCSNLDKLEPVSVASTREDPRSDTPVAREDTRGIVRPVATGKASGVARSPDARMSVATDPGPKGPSTREQARPASGRVDDSGGVAPPHGPRPMTPGRPSPPKPEDLLLSELEETLRSLEPSPEVTEGLNLPTLELRDRSAGRQRGLARPRGICTSCGTRLTTPQGALLCDSCGDPLCVECEERARTEGHRGLCPVCAMLIAQADQVLAEPKDGRRTTDHGAED